MKNVKESEVEKHFVDVSLKHKVWAIKIWPFNCVGFPDRLCLTRPGNCFFVEMKKPKDSIVSDIQTIIHNRLRHLGFKVYVIYTKSEVDEFYKDKDYAKKT